MQWRGPAVLVALVAFGTGSGFAAAAQTRDATTGVGVPAPVPAQRPGLPIEAPTPYTADPDDAALKPGIAMHTATNERDLPGTRDLIRRVAAGMRAAPDAITQAVVS